MTPKAISNGPQLGYAWESDDQTLRPILGVLGSSQVGQSLVTAGAYAAGGASPVSALALLVGADGQLYRMTLPAGTPVQVGVAATAAARIRFSPSGTAAVVFVPGAQSATLLTGLTGTPQLRQISVTAPLLDLAPSDAGTTAALLAGAGQATLALLTAAGNVQPLATLGGAGGLGFIGTADDLLAADSVAGTLTVLRSVSTAPAITQIATAGLLRTPVALGISLNGRWAVIANGADSSVVRIDLTGTVAPRRIVCPAQPRVVESLAGTGSFRFTDVGKAAAWVSDVSASTPSMLFVPART